MPLLDYVVTLGRHPLVWGLVEEWVRSQSRQAAWEALRAWQQTRPVFTQMAAPTGGPAPADDLYAQQQWDTGCVVCGRAHLAAAAATLDRAAALAQDRGRCDADCGYYVTVAQREIANLLEWDWTEAQIVATPDPDQATLRAVKPDVERLRDTLFAGDAGAARLNLTLAAGALEEAGRFARAGGVAHPEAQARIARAEALLTATERAEFAPERVATYDPAVQDAIHAIQPAFRSQRQFLLNGLQTPEDLDRVAAAVGAANTRLNQAVLARTPPDQVAAWADHARAIRTRFRAAVTLSAPASTTSQAVHDAVRQAGFGRWEAVDYTTLAPQPPARSGLVRRPAWLIHEPTAAEVAALTTPPNVPASYDRLEAALQQCGVRVRTRSLPATADWILEGVYTPANDTIQLTPATLTKDSYAAQILVHEAAHALLHDTACLPHPPADHTRQEDQAETVTVLAMLDAGLPIETRDGDLIEPGSIQVNEAALQAYWTPEELRNIQWAVGWIRDALTGAAPVTCATCPAPQAA